MASFGDRLRKERKARNIQLSEVAESTKIRTVYLRALESNDFEELPGGVFNKGFVRAYAECIGIDPLAMLGAYEDEQRAQDRRRRESAAAENGASTCHSSAPKDTVAAGAIPARFRTPLTILATLATLAALAITIWILRPGAPSAGMTAMQPPAATVPDPVAASAPSAEMTTPRPPETDVPAPAAARVEEVASGEMERLPEEDLPVDVPAPIEPMPEGLTLSIPESGIGSRVVDRRLEDPRTTFEAGDRVWFWARVIGGRPEEPIRHVWLHEGAVINSIELILGGSHWRTYSWQTMRPGSEGRWTVEARDAKGRLLVRKSFVCTLP